VPTKGLTAAKSGDERFPGSAAIQRPHKFQDYKTGLLMYVPVCGFVYTRLHLNVRVYK